MMISPSEFLPIPPFFSSEKVAEVWRVPYQIRAEEAQMWAKNYKIKPSCEDKIRICLMIIDAQNTFCLPEFELFVGGRSGRGAIDDNIRLCQFIYRNLAKITTIIPTMDTHTAMQIFHPIFWVNELGEHPQPHTNISWDNVQQEIWKVNPAIANTLGNNYQINLSEYALHYVKKLHDDQKYPLTIWPYHSLLGGIGHSLVSAIEEAIFFHSITRQSPTYFEIKGDHPLTENYSVLRPEVLENSQGKSIAEKNINLLQTLLTFDKVIIGGQAKSHCVAWTIEDLLTEINEINPTFTQKIYLLEDCTSSVVVPGVVDFTAQADTTFQRFADAGMHLITSSLILANLSA